MARSTTWCRSIQARCGYDRGAARHLADMMVRDDRSLERLATLPGSQRLPTSGASNAGDRPKRIAASRTRNKTNVSTLGAVLLVCAILASSPLRAAQWKYGDVADVVAATMPSFSSTSTIGLLKETDPKPARPSENVAEVGTTSVPASSHAR